MAAYDLLHMAACDVGQMTAYVVSCSLASGSLHLFPSDEFRCEHELPVHRCCNAQAVQRDIAHIANKLSTGADHAESFGILLVQ